MISCENNDDVNVFSKNKPITLVDSVNYYYNYADSVGRTLKFMHIEDRIKNQYSTKLTRTPDVSTNIDEIKPEPIIWFLRIYIELGRKSRSCHGFGICGIGIRQQNMNNLDPFVAFDNSSYIETDELGRSYADYLLAEPLDANTDSGALLLPVDEDIQEEVVVEPDEDNINSLIVPQAYKLSQGVYRFNRNLGLYGGYRIYLNPIY